jgi:hypothetical protein
MEITNLYFCFSKKWKPLKNSNQQEVIFWEEIFTTCHVPCHFIWLYFISFNYSMNIYLFDDIIPLFNLSFRPEEGYRLQNYFLVHSSILLLLDCF